VKGSKETDLFFGFVLFAIFSSDFSKCFASFGKYMKLSSFLLWTTNKVGGTGTGAGRGERTGRKEDRKRREEYRNRVKSKWKAGSSRWQETSTRHCVQFLQSKRGREVRANRRGARPSIKEHEKQEVCTPVYPPGPHPTIN